MVARLVAAAAALDARFADWVLAGDDVAGHSQNLLAAAAREACHTALGPLRDTALLVASTGNSAQAPVAGLRIAPPVDNPLLWANPHTGRDCVAAIETARAWLTRHGDGLTVGQLADAARAALAITHHLGYLHTQTEPDAILVRPQVGAVARAWLAVVRACADLRSPAPRETDRNTMTVSLSAVAAWLGTQLRPDGQWCEVVGGDAAAWRETARQITAQLPDLADLLHEAIGAARAHGAVLAASGGIRLVPGHMVGVPDWQPAAARDPAVLSARAGLRRAASSTRELSELLGVLPRPGLAQVPGIPAKRRLPSAAGLVSQWYPQSLDMKEAGAAPARGGHQPHAAGLASQRRGRP